MTLGPDYTQIVVDEVKLPYRNTPYKQAHFLDPLLEGYSATLIADSYSFDDARLATMLTRFPRRILSEINTHRVFSRNSASSRARSVKSTLQSVLDDPFIPAFTENKKGMSGDFLDPIKQKQAEKVWLRGRDKAVSTMLELLLGSKFDDSKSFQELMDQYYDEVYNTDAESDSLSVHKQDANRVLEPWLWHEAIITSSYWDNFFELRTNLSAAEPSIYAIALLMREVLEKSTPVDSKIHLPFISEDLMLTGDEPLEDARDTLMLAATEAAQISYRDKSAAKKSTATTALGERLLAMKHLSPFEHIAYRVDSEVLKHLPDGDYTSNLSPYWTQLRQIFA